MIREKNFIIHQNFPEFLQPFQYFGMARVSPFLIVTLIFTWFWEFGLVLPTALLRFQKSTGLSVLAFRHVYLTQLRDGDLSRTGLPVLCLATLSLDTVEGAMDVEATPGFQNLRHLSRQTTGCSVLSWSPFFVFENFWLGLVKWLVIGFTTDTRLHRSIINIET